MHADICGRDFDTVRITVERYDLSTVRTKFDPFGIGIFTERRKALMFDSDCAIVSSVAARQRLSCCSASPP